MADKLVQTINDFKKSLNGQTISIHGKDYATVALRIAVARRNLGSSLDIKDNIIYQDDKRVIVQTDIFIDGKHVSTGIAEEIRAASRINQTTALENAQTSSVGRALAMLGLTNDNIASAEEVSTAIELQDKKIQTVLKDLEGISHAGSYQAWITTNKSFLSDLKSKNPMSYTNLMERFTQIKSNLKQKGVIQ